MGKRKSKKPAPKAKAPTVSKTFRCPFCRHPSSCEAQLNKEAETGTIGCRVCGQNFQCRIHSLSEPIDVYCEWIDACTREQEEGVGEDGDAAEGKEAEDDNEEDDEDDDEDDDDNHIPNTSYRPGQPSTGAVSSGGARYEDLDSEDES
eukprot:gb/GECG01012423.1/.p1 GENE.gb/GECG01012423.1/~~gb/GECG01012423.1/.p1  ORF type:complete len:148 (+),score=28.36 gb/GECG01012423.1/:1-444(+)